MLGYLPDGFEQLLRFLCRANRRFFHKGFAGQYLVEMVDSGPLILVMTEGGIRRTEDLYPVQKLIYVILISNKERLRHILTLFDSQDRLELIVLRNRGSLEEMCDEADVFL